MDEHETLPTDSILINMLAGGVAGVFENCLFYPLDTAKTRMQDLREVNLKVPKSVINTFYEMMKEEGLLSPYKGFAVTVLGSGPAHAVYFASYELSKAFLQNYRDSSLNYGVAGGVATLAHDGIMTPTEAIKQRMQMENSPYKTFTECIKKVYHTEGLTAFYRSYGTQVIMNIPFQSVQFTSYELTSNFLNPSRSYNPFFHIVAGGIAGAIAAAITTPLDVCKTFLNTQESQVKVTGIKNAVLMVYKLAGPFGYFRGVSARVLFVMPSTAICWATYESMKFGLKSLTSET